MAGARPKILIDRLATHPSGMSLMPVIEKLREGPCKITLDASRVERLDATGLEGLLVIAATQRERGDPFSLENPSDSFQSDLTFFGADLAHLKGPQA